jgi:hypothetical protein
MITDFVPVSLPHHLPADALTGTIRNASFCKIVGHGPGRVGWKMMSAGLTGEIWDKLSIQFRNAVLNLGLPLTEPLRAIAS